MEGRTPSAAFRKQFHTVLFRGRLQSQTSKVALVKILKKNISSSVRFASFLPLAKV